MFEFIYDNIDFAHKYDAIHAPTEVYEKHVHYLNEVYIFINGNVEFTIESTSRKLQKGDIIIIPAGSFHYATVNSNYPYERIVLKFPSSILPNYLQEKMNTISTFLTNTSKYIIPFQEFDEYVKIYSKEEIASLIQCELIKFLIQITNDSYIVSSEYNEFISKLINYIDEHIKDSLSLQSIADHFNFSQSYISNEFKKYLKTPLMQYIKSKKIIAAYHDILNGEKKVVVAEKYGFENYSTFYRSYIKVLGFAPSEKEVIHKN